ncbi:MAG: alpha/beta fold hydrolase [Candidatus Zixiibacteriota bacterium]
MPYAALDSLRLHYEEHRPQSADDSSQQPPVLVFLHGFTLDGRMWAPQVRHFKEAHRVILLDSRGHGLSDAPETGYSRAHRVEDLESFVKHLGIDRFHLIGLSMGGSTGIGYALKYQHKLLSLTLVSTGAAGYQIGKKMSLIDRIARERGIAAAKQKWKKIALGWYGHDRQEIKNLMQIMVDAHSGAVWRDPMRGKYPRENDLEQVHRITVPTMIMAGESDSVFVSLARLLHERIQESRLSVFPEIGHMVNLEAPERFNRELQQFLDSSTPDE